MTPPTSSTDTTKDNSPDPLLISHMDLRRLLGWLGFLLPIVLFSGVYALKTLFDIGEHETDEVFQSSISHYYYSVMGDVFVAVVAAFGLFLFTYKGYASEQWWKNDNLFTNAAGACAIVVALFPGGDKTCPFTCSVHFAAAVAFFIILAYISLILFTQSDKDPKDRDWRKVTRNRIFRVCGITMIICLLILAYYFLQKPAGWPTITVFLFEAIALVAFGVSWLVKGETILGDKKHE